MRITAPKLSSVMGEKRIHLEFVANFITKIKFITIGEKLSSAPDNLQNLLMPVPW